MVASSPSIVSSCVVESSPEPFPDGIEPRLSLVGRPILLLPPAPRLKKFFKLQSFFKLVFKNN